MLDAIGKVAPSARSVRALGTAVCVPSRLPIEVDTSLFFVSLNSTKTWNLREKLESERYCGLIMRSLLASTILFYVQKGLGSIDYMNFLDY